MKLKTTCQEDGLLPRTVSLMGAILSQYYELRETNRNAILNNDLRNLQQKIKDFSSRFRQIHHVCLG